MPDNSRDAAPDSVAGSSLNDALWNWLNHLKWIDFIGSVVTSGLGYAPRQQVGLIVVAFLVAIVGLIISLSLVYIGRADVGGVIAGGSILALVIAMYFLRQTPPTFSQLPATPPGENKTQTGKWSRVMINLPLPQMNLQQLENAMNYVRSMAQSAYEQLRNSSGNDQGLDKRNVRTNIFLPDNRQSSYGDVCDLFIPDSLHAGMTNLNELGIRFRTKEGVTGQVYSEQRAIGARRNTQSETGWERISMDSADIVDARVFPLTHKQVSLIDPSLQWIVSIPIEITRDRTRHTVGVFNIDGLVDTLELNEMQAIYRATKDAIKDLAKILGNLPQCRVTIFVDDISA